MSGVNYTLLTNITSLCRRYQLEAELNSMNWRIRSEEILHNRHRGGTGMNRHTGLQSGMSMSIHFCIVFPVSCC